MEAMGKWKGVELEGRAGGEKKETERMIWIGFALDLDGFPVAYLASRTDPLPES